MSAGYSRGLRSERGTMADREERLSWKISESKALGVASCLHFSYQRLKRHQIQAKKKKLTGTKTKNGPSIERYEGAEREGK